MKPHGFNEDTLKAWLARHIACRLESNKLTQTEAAKRMGLKQPDLSAVLNGKFKGFSAERLARCLSALGGDVRLTVREASGSDKHFALKAD